MQQLNPIFFLFIIVGLFSRISAQQLDGQLGAGIGWGFNSDDNLLPDNAVRAPLRFIFQAGINYHVTDYFDLGLEVSTSVFQRLDIFTLDVKNELEDGSEIFDPLRTYSSIIALKPAYVFEHKGFEPFVALGFGYNFHVNRIGFDSAGDIERQKTQTLSIIPEVGVGIGDFQVALKSVIGGKIDGFQGVDTNGNNLILRENNFLMFYITGSYRFRISKIK